MIDINWHPTQRQLRQFAGLFLPAFLVLAGFMAVGHGAGWLWPAVLWSAAGVVAAIGLARPAWIRPVFIAFMCAAYPIGWLVSHLLLAVAYYGVFTPVGLLMRLCGRDPMHRRFDRAASSYWVARQPSKEIASYFRQF